MLSKLTVFSTLAMLVLGIGGTARAQPSDYRTYFTFTTPVTLTGHHPSRGQVSIPAGRSQLEPQSHQRPERGWQDTAGDAPYDPQPVAEGAK
jgi:hypothetical protein